METLLEKILSTAPNPSSIKIKNKEQTEQIIKSIHTMGPQSFQVITDFDMTLTRYHHGGTRCHSSFGVMDNSPLMSEEFKKTAHTLLNKYYPIEIDHEMTTEEKIPHMEIWYRECNENIASQNIEKSLVKKMVADSRALLRDNTVDALKMLYEANIPVLVFSAGLGNILEEVLHKYNTFHPNIKIISNFMIFDENEKFNRFTEPVIHMFNKNQAALVESDYFTNLETRGNVILLGDTLGDIQMSAGIPNPGVVLKIGFLNVNITERLEDFMENFDIVLVDDQSMNFLNSLLTYLLEEK